MRTIYASLPLTGPARHPGRAVLRAARATRDRESILGRCSLDSDGHTTTTAYGRLVIVDGELVSA